MDEEYCLVIEPSGDISLPDYPHRASISDENACLRALIGKGCEFYEVVRIGFAGRRMIMLVDEEGLLKGDLKYNSLASMLYGGWIMGTAVLVTTETNDEGEELFRGFDYDEVLWLAERLQKIVKPLRNGHSDKGDGLARSARSNASEHRQ